MAQWHFQKGGTVATCQQWMGNTRVDATGEGYSPSGDRPCSWNVILTSSATWESWTLSRLEDRNTAWKWGNLAEGREQKLCHLTVLGSNLSPDFCWSGTLLYSILDNGTSFAGLSKVLVILGIVPGAQWVTSWCLTVVHLALVIHIASLFNISFKPLDMNDSS